MDSCLLTRVLLQAARFPKDSFPYLKFLQGCSCNGFRNQLYSQISATTIVEDPERHTCVVQRPDGSLWTVEELVGMQFMYIKQLAEQESGEKITEAVVTVCAPSIASGRDPFLTQEH